VKLKMSIKKTSLLHTLISSFIYKLLLYKLNFTSCRQRRALLYKYCLCKRWNAKYGTVRFNL